MPVGQLPAGMLDDPGADPYDLAGLLGQRDEDIGRDRATRGVGPAEQRLEGDQCARVQAHDGLVADLQLVAVHGMEQLRAQAEPVQ